MSSVRLLLDTAEPAGEPRTGARRFWTGREMMILRNAYPVSGLEGCLDKLPGRSAQAIYLQAGKAGLKSPRETAPRGKRLASTDQIDALIRRTCQDNPESGAIKRLAQTINRSRQWIRDQAIRLGCAVPRFKELPWTGAEIDIITEDPHLGPMQLQRRLRKAGFQRTAVAIGSKLGVLGVSTIDPDHHTANGLGKLFGVNVKTVTGWIDKGWLRAQRRGTARIEEQGGDQWWIHIEQVRRFVIANAAAVDLRKVDKFWFIELLGGCAVERIASQPDGATIDGVKVALSRQEYVTLELLASRAGVASREWLYARLAEDGYHGGPKVLDVVVCRLRRKLTAAGWAGAIKGRWGEGYELTSEARPVAALNG